MKELTEDQRKKFISDCIGAIWCVIIFGTLFGPIFFGIYDVVTQERNGIYSDAPMEVGLFRYTRPDGTTIEINGTMVAYSYVFDYNYLTCKEKRELSVKNLGPYRVRRDCYVLFLTNAGKYLVLNVLPYEEKCRQDAKIVLAWSNCEDMEPRNFSEPQMRLLQVAKDQDPNLYTLAQSYNTKVR